MSLWYDLRVMLARAIAPGQIYPHNRWFSGRTQAGVYVDGDTMLRNAVVWACIQYLTRAVGQLPWRVCRELPDGNGSERVPTNQVDWLINKRPNPEMGAMTFKQTLLASALTRGNGYAEIQRDARGIPIALWPIATSRVQPRRRVDTGELYYCIFNGAAGYNVDGYSTAGFGGGFVELDAMNCFHLRGFPGPDGVIGLDVASYAAQSIGWAQATELFGASFFGEGMNPAGVIEMAKGLDEPGLKKLKAELADLYKGPRKANKTAFLDAGMKWTRMSVQPDEAQFIQTMQHQVEEICRWFSVPPHKVMHLLHATFSNIENQSIEVVVDSIAPWAKLFEEEADYKFFGAANRQGFYTKMYLQGLLRGDAKSRSEYFRNLRECGVMSPNEVRELEDMNPIGPSGDIYTMQSQYTTLELIKNPPAPPKPAATPSTDATSADGSVVPADTTQTPRKASNGSGLPH